MSFAESETAKKWIFKEEELRQHRLDAIATDGAIDASNPAEQAQRLTLEEQNLILTHWTRSYTNICHMIAPDMPQRVRATGFSFFKRYFVKHSINNPANDPGPLLLASVYSACKTEEFRKVTYLHIKNVLQKEPALKVTEVKELELRLLEGVQFHLNVYHPFNPAYAIIQDFLLFSQNHSNGDLSAKLRYEVDVILMFTLLHSDATLLFPPTLIAIAAIEVALGNVHMAQSPGSVEDSPLLAPFAEYTALLLQEAPEESRVALDSARRYIVTKPTEADKEGTRLANRKLNAYKKWLAAERAKIVMSSAVPEAPVENSAPQQPTDDVTMTESNTA